MRIPALLIAALFALPTHAAVKMAGQGLTSDSSQAPEQLEGQTFLPVHVDRKAIEESARTGELLLPGTRGQVTRARFVSLKRRDDGLSIWIGKVDSPLGPQSVVLTLGDGIAFGLIPQPDGVPLRLETRKSRTWLVEGVATAPDFEFPNSDVLIPPVEPGSREKRAAQDRLKVLPAPVVEVVVVYNATLATVMGSDAAVQARITHLEAITNQAYIDSNAEVEIRVLAKHLVDYSVNNDNNVALNEITQTSSLPIKTEVNRLRTLYGADLVSLIRNFDRTTQNSCGIAWLLGTNGSSFSAFYGFSVVSDRGFGGDNCGEWTFAHELGHNMGAHHDTETASGEAGAYPYSFGFRRTLSASSGFATVMAYSVSPQTRLGYFSNPRISTCLGQPCGDAATADNARGLGEAAPAMSSLVATLPATSLPSLTMDDVSVTEGNSGTKVVSFVVRLSAASATPVTFNLTTVAGSASAGSDFVPLNNVPGSIPAGQTSASFDVTVRGDTEVEQNEIFGLNLSNASGARIRDGQGIATITNDEPIPDVTIADVNVDEGNSGFTLATFTVSLSQSSNTPVTFSADSFRYADGPNSATENVDFQHIAYDNLVIPAGATSAQFTARVIGETLVEQDESFYVNLSNLTAANLADGRSNVWIRNDDGVANRPGISIADATVVEGNAGTSTATFTISLTQPAVGQVRFGVTTSDGNAEAGSDYVAKTTVLQTINSGQSSGTFTVTINGDLLAEPDEFFNVSLFNVNGADIVDAQAIGTITNDDAGGLPVIAARDDRVVLRENSPAATINVIANDVFTASRLAGGSLSITTPPAQGSASVQNNGTTGTAADDTIRFTAGANFSGESLVGYRLCEGVAGARCVDGILSVVLRPSLDVAISSATGSGFQDVAMADLRALPAAEFSATKLRAPVLLDQALAVDPTPETPWDAGRAGTQFVLRTLLQAAQDWRVLVDARSLAAGDVDLYLGVDTDNDGTPDANEVRCTAAMSASTERCELALNTASANVNYWVMAHNRSAGAHTARLDLYEVPLVGNDAGPVLSGLVATGPGKLPADADFPLRLGWTDHELLPAATRLGYVRVKSDAGTDAGLFPVRIERTASDIAPLSLSSAVIRSLALPAGAAQDRMYIDVPAGATRLVVATTSSQNVDVYLASTGAPSSPTIAAAPARGSAQASATTASGNESITLLAPTLTPGRWYVTVVNASAGPANFTVRATVVGSAPTVRHGSYFNAARGGHGLFLYPAGNELVGLWYTYLQDGSPTWYYLQGPAPAVNGLWTGTLYRSAWTGTTNKLTAIGQGQMAPSGADAFTFSYALDGETGAEPLTALGRGCPTLASAPLNVSSHWYSASAAGSGYSVQLFPNYEFYTTFVYDGWGVPRYLLAERNGFGGASASLDLMQLKGFCPLCTRTGNPTRVDVGSFNRSYAAGSFGNITQDAIFTDGLPGAWSTNHSVQLLGGAGTAQGCVTP